MPYTTDAALLQDVRNAIQAIVSGRAQSYSLNMGGGGSRSVTKLDLKELREMEQELAIRVERQTKSPFGVVKFRGMS